MAYFTDLDMAKIVDFIQQQEKNKVLAGSSHGGYSGGQNVQTGNHYANQGSMQSIPASSLHGSNSNFSQMSIQELQNRREQLLRSEQSIRTSQRTSRPPVGAPRNDNVSPDFAGHSWSGERNILGPSDASFGHDINRTYMERDMTGRYLGSSAPKLEMGNADLPGRERGLGSISSGTGSRFGPSGVSDVPNRNLLPGIDQVGQTGVSTGQQFQLKGTSPLPWSSLSGKTESNVYGGQRSSAQTILSQKANNLAYDYLMRQLETDEELKMQPQSGGCGYVGPGGDNNRTQLNSIVARPSRQLETMRGMETVRDTGIQTRETVVQKSSTLQNIPERQLTEKESQLERIRQRKMEIQRELEVLREKQNIEELERERQRLLLSLKYDDVGLYEEKDTDMPENLVEATEEDGEEREKMKDRPLKSRPGEHKTQKKPVKEKSSDRSKVQQEIEKIKRESLNRERELEKKIKCLKEKLDTKKPRVKDDLQGSKQSGSKKRKSPERYKSKSSERGHSSHESQSKKMKTAEETKPSKRSSDECTICVKNLPSHILDSRLRCIFSKYGGISNIKVPKTGVRSGVFITFKHDKDAKKVVRISKSNKRILTYDRRPLEISLDNNKEETSYSSKYSSQSQYSCGKDKNIRKQIETMKKIELSNKIITKKEDTTRRRDEVQMQNNLRRKYDFKMDESSKKKTEDYKTKLNIKEETRKKKIGAKNFDRKVPAVVKKKDVAKKEDIKMLDLYKKADYTKNEKISVWEEGAKKGSDDMSADGSVTKDVFKIPNPVVKKVEILKPSGTSTTAASSLRGPFYTKKPSVRPFGVAYFLSKINQPKKQKTRKQTKPVSATKKAAPAVFQSVGQSKTKPSQNLHHQASAGPLPNLISAELKNNLKDIAPLQGLPPLDPWYHQQGPPLLFPEPENSGYYYGGGMGPLGPPLRFPDSGGGRYQHGLPSLLPELEESGYYYGGGIGPFSPPLGFPDRGRGMDQHGWPSLLPQPGNSGHNYGEGYQPEMRVCKHFIGPKGCKLGEKCKFLHIASTTDAW